MSLEFWGQKNWYWIHVWCCPHMIAEYKLAYTENDGRNDMSVSWVPDLSPLERLALGMS